MTTPTPLTQDELKTLVGQAALQFIVPGDIVGVGTGSTVNKFIDALATMKDQIPGAVSSSVASTARLKALGIPVFEANEVAELSVYIDGADEIDAQGHMIKGGGAALTREKIVAAQSRRFICIADESKMVKALGAFPLPVEVIPMATARLIRQFAALGGKAHLRLKDGAPLVTDNGQHILLGAYRETLALMQHMVDHGEVDHLVPERTPDPVLSYPGLHQMYQVVKDMPTHQARKDQDKALTRQQDSVRLKAEQDLKDFILADTNALLKRFQSA